MSPSHHIIIIIYYNNIIIYIIIKVIIKMIIIITLVTLLSSLIYICVYKVGLPKENVKGKMMQEGGVKPDYLDKDPDELIPVDEGGEEVAESPIKKRPPIVIAKKASVRKKKLHWRALDETKVPSVTDRQPWQPTTP